MARTEPYTRQHETTTAFAHARERHEFLLRYAILAPSTMNTQPWLFRTTDSYIEIQADPKRQLKAMDESGREMVISCGAALANAEIASRHLGYVMHVEKNGREPHPGDWLARLHSQSPSPPRELDSLLFNAIRHRHTVRKPFLDRSIAAGLVRKIMDMADGEASSMIMVDDPATRIQLAEAAAAWMMKLAGNNARQQEARRWRASWSEERRDGIPQASLGMSPAEYLWLYLVGGNKAVSAQTGKLITKRLLECPRMVVLSTPGDTRHDWLEAGYAMQRALLRAASIGIQASFLGALINTPEARSQTRQILGLTHMPQLVLGLGHTKTSPLTPRRPLEEFLLKS